METQRKRGRPPGSTNKVRAESAPQAAEEKIAGRLDDVLDVLLDAATEDRDIKVAMYLVNRVLGRPTEKQEVVTKGEQTIKVEYVEDGRNQ